MRHRQTTGAGPSGTRPSIAILMMTAAGGGLATGLGQPAGAWAGFGMSSVAAILGFGALWQQRGLLERRAKETARRRRADLDALAAAEHRHRTELERVRAELEHEQQYSALTQEQLTRARREAERERAARRAAELELDALTGAEGWQAAASSLLLTVEEPRARREQDREASSVLGGDEPAANADARGGNAAARRRGWQVVDGDGADEARSEAAGEETARVAKAAGGEKNEEQAVRTDRLYRPFIEHLAVTAAPVSEAALAMAPVIGAADLDGILDLTAYDETVEFSVRELKDMA